MRHTPIWRCLAFCLILMLACAPIASAVAASPTCVRLLKVTTTKATTVAGRSAASANAKPVAQSSLEKQVLEQVNAERAKRGLSALRVDATLSRAARTRASEIMIQFSHTRPNGTPWSTVSAKAYGENIAMGQRTADKVMAAWMSSAGHRANILRASYGSIGVAAVVSGGVTYWVQLFGK